MMTPTGSDIFVAIIHEVKWRHLSHCDNKPACWRYTECEQRLELNCGNLRILVPCLFADCVH